MIDNDLKKKARQKRGEITAEFTAQFAAYSDQDLINQLSGCDPQVRAAAAKILGERKSRTAIPTLCDQLSREKALYTKIAISNALSSIGIAALPELLKYIAKIGNNQYRDMPDEIFKKWNYPCPRDIVIRCIIRMGKPALRILNEFLQSASEKELSELIDVIGHISFYSEDQSSFNNLLIILAKYPDQKLLVWKVIRALQAFPNQQALQILRDFLFNSDIPQHRFEAARSLGQIATKAAEEYLRMAKNDSDAKVRTMARLSLKHIHDSNLKSNRLGE